MANRQPTVANGLPVLWLKKEKFKLEKIIYQNKKAKPSYTCSLKRVFLIN
jgi:hypothetical protein